MEIGADPDLHPSPFIVPSVAGIIPARPKLPRSQSFRTRCSMQRLVSFGIFAMCLTQLCLAQQAPVAQGTAAAPHTVVIRARSLIDGTSAQPRANQEILISGDRITAVYAAGTRPAPPGTKRGT